MIGRSEERLALTNQFVLKVLAAWDFWRRQMAYMETQAAAGRKPGMAGDQAWRYAVDYHNGAK
ncbi:MAG: hypothetical protein J2P54_08540 [Bradyrhizobiaceae bacterium]|nr:hypothetical protein [Bradyrhizobiaceae bacterium]